MNDEMTNLIPFLNEELKAIDDAIPNINNGGCGIFAYYLSDFLDRIGIKNSIVVEPGFWNPSWITNSNLEELKRDNGKIYLLEDIHFAHLQVITEDNHYIDSTGVMNFPYYEGETTTVDKNVLTLMLAWAVWNPAYSRTNNSEMKRMFTAMESKWMALKSKENEILTTSAA